MRAWHRRGSAKIRVSRVGFAAQVNVVLDDEFAAKGDHFFTLGRISAGNFVLESLWVERAS
jgi:hypothetical protein